MVPRRALALPVLFLAMAAACEIHDGENPVITITSPADGAINDSSSIEVIVDVDRFTLDPEVFPPDDDDHSQAFHGHWHLYIRPDLGPEYLFVDDQFTTEALITNVPPGVHEIAVELVNQNHTRIFGTDIEFALVEIPSTAPRIVFVEPDYGDTLNSSSADVVIGIDNVVVSSNLGGPNVAGEGHFHVQVDGREVVESIATSFTLSDLVLTTQGIAASPVIDLELVQNDHSSFPTRVLDRATVTVPAAAPRVFVTEPAEGAVIGTSLVMDFAFGNFQLVDFTAVTSESDGQGHYHVLVDGNDAGHDHLLAPPAFTLQPGAHEIRFELRSNLHDSLVPPVVDIVHVTATN